MCVWLVIHNEKFANMNDRKSQNEKLLNAGLW